MPTTTSPRPGRDEELAEDGLGQPTDVAPGTWRAHVRSKPGLRHAYRVGVFALGLVFIAGGVALAVLPGPLTIPPVLLGLWIWSTEFAFADRLFVRFKDKALAARAHAKEHPVSAAFVTVGGLLAAGAVFWAIQHFALVDTAKDAIGLG